uniref:Aminoglycoside 6'-N-acetyltransferase n=1 Tax=uncultured soil bacterium TaxID=164851 RepID=Q6Q217_9BACT|nr:aminoglycoside 6'-N-acetyltransferase [uncultured soil bacterium]
MIPQFTISNLPSDDTDAVEQCAALLVEGFKQHWPAAWPDLDSARKEVHEMLAENRICRVAVDREANVIGWIGGIPEYDGNVWELHPLVVKPEQQQQGIGRTLVIDFEAQVQARGGLTIRLGSDDEDGMTSLSNVNLFEDTWEQIAGIENLKGHPYEFYQKCGYVIVGVVPDANGPGKPDILMAKSVRRPGETRW